MKEKKGILLALITAFISGGAIFINTFGVKVINPYIFTGLKNIVVIFLILALIFVLKEWPKFKKLRKKEWGLLFLIGLVGGSIPFLLFFKGLSLTTGDKGAFIHKTMFVYVAILAFIFLKEKISKSLIVGILVLILGNVLLLKIIPKPLNFGDFLILIATLFWSGEQIISKYTLKTISPRLVAGGRMFFGSILIVLFWIITGQFQFLAEINLIQFSWVVITAFILFGYVTFWYTALKYSRVSVATAVLTLGSPITTLLSLIFLDKVISPQQIGGIALILVGILLVIGISRTFRSFKKIFYVRT